MHNTPAHSPPSVSSLAPPARHHRSNAKKRDPPVASTRFARESADMLSMRALMYLVGYNKCRSTETVGCLSSRRVPSVRLDAAVVLTSSALHAAVTCTPQSSSSILHPPRSALAPPSSPISTGVTQQSASREELARKEGKVSALGLRPRSRAHATSRTRPPASAPLPLVPSLRRPPARSGGLTLILHGSLRTSRADLRRARLLARRHVHRDRHRKVERSSRGRVT